METIQMNMEAIAKEAIEKHHAAQREWELTSLLKFAYRFGVKNVLEIGCGAGGMLWAWQEIGCKVVGVNLTDGMPVTPESRMDFPLNAHGARVIVADSHDIHTVRKVDDIYDLVFIDASHTLGGVVTDYFNYEAMAKEGGLVMLHDIHAHLIDKRIEVHKLWQHIKVESVFSGNPNITLEITAPENPLGIGIVMKGG